MASAAPHPMVGVGGSSSSTATGPKHASRPPLGSGYESPGEEKHLNFFTSASGHHTPLAAPIPAASSLGNNGPARRPGFTSLPFYNPAPPRNAQMPHHMNLDYALKRAKLDSSSNDKIGWRERVVCYQWTYFTMTMATGGIANILHALPYKAHWIEGCGLFFFFLNLCLFLLNCIMISTRFRLRPGSFTQSFTDQRESLFIPAFVVSIAIILINICQYGIPHTGHWLLSTMEILFWLYVGLSVAASAGLYLILWSTLVFPVHTMTPTWVFPAYPLLLTAPLATTLIQSADKSGQTLSINTVAVAFGAAAIQGTGCLIAFMISAAFVYRLMTQKLPRDMQRPGVFISIGPFGFTAAGISQLGNQASRILPPNFLDSAITVDVIRIVSLLVGLWLWGLSIWFFLVSVGSLWKYILGGHSIPFQMTWWSFVFPNTALVSATIIMGEIFDSHGLKICGAVLTAALVVVWVCIFATMINCLRKKKLLWPKDE